MEPTRQNQGDDGLFPSVFVSKNWPYAGVDEELQQKKFEGKPYGPFHEWVFQLKLNVNNNADLLTCHVLLCMLNYAATHDNRIDDTRDFLGFLWWYNERVKKLPGMDDSDRRKAVYKSLVYRMIERTDYVSIDRFSPSGEIYSVSMLEKNAGISEYMAVKIKLQRLYAGIGELKGRDFTGYLDLREIDQTFFETLSDPDIYGAYIREFFLYELTPENIGDILENPKLAVIKIPTRQNVLITPEYLCQLSRISFMMLSGFFTDPERAPANRNALSGIIDRANAKYNKKYTPHFAHEQMKDPETMETEHEFWSVFLESVTSLTPEEAEGTGNLQMYAFLLGAVMPEAAEETDGKTITKILKSTIRKGDIAGFLTLMSEDKTADYTFASLMELFGRSALAEKFSGMERDFVEESLDVLIKEGQITRIREPNPRNVSHFIVTRNLINVFYAFIGKIRERFLAQYQTGMPGSDNEYRLDLEKKISSGFPVFYQLYVRKDFAANVFRLIGRMDPQASAAYQSKLFIAGAAEPAFLPLPELLEMDYSSLKARVVPVPAAAGLETSGEPPVAESSGEPAAAVKESSSGSKPDIIVPVESEPSAAMTAEKTGKPVKTARKIRKSGAEHPPADFLELYLLFVRMVGRFLRWFFGGLKKSMNNVIEKDLAKKKADREAQARGKTPDKETSSADEAPAESRSEAKKEIELSLQAVTKNLIEDFTGSDQLTIAQAVHTLEELWNQPKTLNKEEEAFAKKDNLSAVNTIINNNTMNLYGKNVSEAKILERASEIVEFREITDLMQKLVRKSESKEILKRYIALGLCAVLLRK